MENERESITQVRVGLYRKALDQLREENELAEREAERTKEAEARSAKDPDAETATKADKAGSDRDRQAAHGSSDKA